MNNVIDKQILYALCMGGDTHIFMHYVQCIIIIMYMNMHVTVPIDAVQVWLEIELLLWKLTKILKRYMYIISG